MTVNTPSSFDESRPLTCSKRGEICLSMIMVHILPLQAMKLVDETSLLTRRADALDLRALMMLVAWEVEPEASLVEKQCVSKTSLSTRRGWIQGL